MRRKIAFGVVCLSVLLAGAFVARGDDGGPRTAGWQTAEQFGRDGGFGPHAMGPWHGQHAFGGGRGVLGLADNPRVRAYLNLTDQQTDRLHQIAVDSEKSSVKTRADLHLRGIELRELLRADNVDRDAVLKKVDELSALRGQIAKQHMEAMLSARSLLTPEQQKKLRSFRENRGFGGPGHEHMMPRHVGPGGPPHPDAPAAPPAHPDEPPVQ